MTLKYLSGFEIIRIFEKIIKMSGLTNKKYIKKDLKKSGVNFNPDNEIRIMRVRINEVRL